MILLSMTYREIVEVPGGLGYTVGSRSVAKWRNWQTHQTQNLAHFTVRVGSTPTFATNSFREPFIIRSSHGALQNPQRCRLRHRCAPDRCRSGPLLSREPARFR